jgi:hypothetical protein
VPALSVVSRAPVDRMIQEDDVREAVFRYRIESRNLSGPIFLSIDGKDPSDAFMMRFAQSNLPIKKASGAYLKALSLRDRLTDQQAVELSVRSVSWISVDRVEVRGGFYCGGRCADAGIYRVGKRNGRWMVEKYEVQAIS